MAKRSSETREIPRSFCLFVLRFYGPVNNEVMSSRSVNSSLAGSTQLTSTKRGRPRQ